MRKLKGQQIRFIVTVISSVILLIILLAQTVYSVSPHVYSLTGKVVSEPTSFIMDKDHRGSPLAEDEWIYYWSYELEIKSFIVNPDYASSGVLTEGETIPVLRPKAESKPNLEDTITTEGAFHDIGYYSGYFEEGLKGVGWWEQPSGTGEVGTFSVDFIQVWLSRLGDFIQAITIPLIVIILVVVFLLSRSG